MLLFKNDIKDDLKYFAKYSNRYPQFTKGSNKETVTINTRAKSNKGL